MSCLPIEDVNSQSVFGSTDATRNASLARGEEETAGNPHTYMPENHPTLRPATTTPLPTLFAPSPAQIEACACDYNTPHHDFDASHHDFDVSHHDYEDS